MYSHIVQADAGDTADAKNHPGPVQVGEDLMVIEVGEKIDIRRFALALRLDAEGVTVASSLALLPASCAYHCFRIMSVANVPHAIRWCTIPTRVFGSGR